MSGNGRTFFILNINMCKDTQFITISFFMFELIKSNVNALAFDLQTVFCR